MSSFANPGINSTSAVHQHASQYDERPDGCKRLAGNKAETKDAPKADLAIAPTRDLGHDKTEELAPTHMIARRLLG